MPEVEGPIRRFNDAGFEVVVGITRLRCSLNLWQNFKRHFKVGDYVVASYTLVGTDETKVVRTMIKREDLRV